MQDRQPLELMQRARSFEKRIAIQDAEGKYSYQKLLQASQGVAASLLDHESDLHEARVAFLFRSGFDYVAVQWGIWQAGGLAVPLCDRHPEAEWRYVLDDADVSTLVVQPEFLSQVQPLAQQRSIRLLAITEEMKRHTGSLPAVSPSRRAMILYTSGTTGKPKGVVTTHQTIQAQIRSLVDAWQWNAQDYILNVLPLHHIHGIINILGCALWSGATCEMHDRFEAPRVIQRLSRGDVTLFMAVPTLYVKLIAAWEKLPGQERLDFSRGCKRLRLMVSGSAALPVDVFHQWEKISGHRLLERYGMTEIGMGLSNPLHGERRPGSVGTPLPGVQLALFDEAHQIIHQEGVQGEIRVRGDQVFLEYWRNPRETEKAFVDGWFRTGDVAVKEKGSYRILGRSSVDIIKSGGYKISALEIEAVLRNHPSIKDCAVVGVDDAEWGQRVAAALVCEPGKELSLEQQRLWAKDHLAKYKLPTLCVHVRELPRNTMGKVDKAAVKELFKTS